MRFEAAAGEAIGTRDQRARDRGSLSRMFQDLRILPVMNQDYMAIVRIPQAGCSLRLRARGFNDHSKQSQGRARVVFTRLEPTCINPGGTVRAYHLYISMFTTGEMRHSIGILIVVLVAEINDWE
jgi:hypothetical protein